MNLFFYFTLSLCSAWIRFGARNCLDCFNSDRKNPLPFYCQNGREMGWCCPDTTRYECQQHEYKEMYCSYSQEFHDDLKYFTCIRDNNVCGSHMNSLISVPNINQTMNYSKPVGVQTTFGDVCWYELK